MVKVGITMGLTFYRYFQPFRLVLDAYYGTYVLMNAYVFRNSITHFTTKVEETELKMKPDTNPGAEEIRRILLPRTLTTFRRCWATNPCHSGHMFANSVLHLSQHETSAAFR